MSRTTIRQCPGWWPALVRAECEDCGWVGPTRDMNRDRDHVLVKIDRNDHACERGS